MSSSENKAALKSGVWYIFGNFLLKGIGFLTTPIFSRLMTQEEIGDFSNLITWIGIVSIVVTFDLYSSIAVARFDFKNSPDEYISSILGLGSFVTVVIFAIAFPFRKIILNFVGFSEYAFYLAFAYMLFYPAIQIFQAKSQVEYKYKTSLAISLSTALASSLLSLALVFVFSNKLDGRVIGHFIPFIAVGIVVYISYIARNRIKTKYWKYALGISTPLIFHLLAGYVLSSSDRVMIHSLIGSREAGLYSVAYTCAMLVNVLMTSMNSAWVPWSMSQIDKGNVTELKTKAKLFVGLFGFLVFGVILLGPETLLIMGGKSYSEAVGVIPPVMICIVFQFIYTLYVNIEQYYKKQKVIAIGTVISACTNVLLNWIFIPIYGYIAAAYTTLFSYTVLFLIHFLFVKKLGKNHIYDGKFNIFFLCTSIFILFFSLFLYTNNILRYLVLCIVAGGLVIALVKQRNALLLSLKTKSLAPLMQALDEIKNSRKRGKIQ